MKMFPLKALLVSCALFGIGITAFSLDFGNNSNKGDDTFSLKREAATTSVNVELEGEWYSVSKVVDGDTIDVNCGERVCRVRMIGVDTPETVHPQKRVECFGKEASDYSKQKLGGARVRLVVDETQGDTDTYGRLLRYVFREDGVNHNHALIQDGYAHEYTYRIPYRYQSEFKEAEMNARDARLGLWGNVCAGDGWSGVSVSQETTQIAPKNEVGQECSIKGNINMEKEKIYHLSSCESYEKTTIDTSQGERWFCTEEEAIRAGWRRAGNCK